MNFRTELKIKPQQNKIDYTSKVLLIGSCFTQNIGDKLTYYKLNNLINPFGILFHPKAIENLIVASLENRFITEDDLVFHNERWHCFDVHSDFSGSDKNLMLANINSAIKQTKNYIETASHIVLTLGTAWVYRYNITNNLVANCHKIPQKEFQKNLLPIDEIVKSLSNIIVKIKAFNPKATIIFTVSPIRHLKDGFIENQLSKAHLLSAIHQINAPYFPAYEILMDDLRDYRFYAKDMIHPNEIAIDYIWQKFMETWINPSENDTMEQINQIQKGLAHRPFDENSENHQLFLKKLHQKITDLEKTKGIIFR
jgi:hypothetical protein